MVYSRDANATGKSVPVQSLSRQRQSRSRFFFESQSLSRPDPGGTGTVPKKSRFFAIILLGQEKNYENECVYYKRVQQAEKYALYCSVTQTV